MKKVFEAELIVRFSHPLSLSLKENYLFASANGISGKVIVSKITDFDSKSYKLNYEVITERKRQFPDFESYLELIKTVMSDQNGVSVLSLNNIIVKKTMQNINDCLILYKQGDYKVIQDEDFDYLIVMIKNNMIINSFATLELADSALLDLIG